MIAASVRRLDPADGAGLAAAYEIRHEVFVVGQQVPPDLERDADDGAALHVLAEIDGRPVGAGRLVARPDGVGVLGRLAVVEGARGTGVGRDLVRALEAVARTEGLRAVELHAQTHALDFYARLGWTPFGEDYEEAGIPHRSMVKLLAASGQT